MKVLILKGLPASGKSTYAKKLVDKGDWKRVNKDDLRAMMDNSQWSKRNEKFVIKTRNDIILLALEAGFNVVVDDTNLHPKHESDIHELVRNWNKVNTEQATVSTKFFDVPVDVCIERDLKRPASVGERVIRRFYNDFLKAPTDLYLPPENKPKAIIVDIDGTLAHNNSGRNIYDYAKALDDDFDEVVGDIVFEYAKNGYEIIVCSGREDDCRDVTEVWLEKHGIVFTELLMRKAGDFRQDSIVKRELFDQHIRDHYRVHFVLDDRNQVVDMWRGLGLKVLQVADGNF